MAFSAAFQIQKDAVGKSIHNQNSQDDWNKIKSHRKDTKIMLGLKEKSKQDTRRSKWWHAKSPAKEIKVKFSIILVDIVRRSQIQNFKIVLIVLETNEAKDDSRLSNKSEIVTRMTCKTLDSMNE